MTQWFPRNVSSFGAEIDSLFMIILVITGLIFVLVEGALIYFVLKYRHRPGRVAKHLHGNTRLEVIWTAIPCVIVIFIAVVSMDPWMRQRNPARFPTPDLTIEITAKQFEWNVRYPGPDQQIGTADDLTSRNRLNLPVGRTVHAYLMAEDVIHSFFLPEFRVKQDAVPGMRIAIWFDATESGEFVLGCAELCGLGHYRMKGTVNVVDAVAFDAWHNSGGTLALKQNKQDDTERGDQVASARPVAAAANLTSGHGEEHRR